MRAGGPLTPGRGRSAGPGELGLAACSTCVCPALREQARLKALVVDRDTEAWQRDPAFSGLQRVGGVDVSFVKDDSVSACASLVVLNYPELEVTPGGDTGLRPHRSGPGALVREAEVRPGNCARAEPCFFFCGSCLISWKDL